MKVFCIIGATIGVLCFLVGFIGKLFFSKDDNSGAKSE